MSEPRELLDQFLGEAWDAVDAFCRAAAADGPLRALQPDPSFTTAPFKERVLGQIDSLALGDAVAAAGFALLRALVPAAVSPGDPVRLHGWDPGGGLPRTIALVMQPPGAIPCTVALVFPTSAAGTPTLRVVAQVAGAAGGIFPAGSSLNASLRAREEGERRAREEGERWRGRPASHNEDSVNFPSSNAVYPPVTAVVGVAAAFVPARRAVRMDPLMAAPRVMLRYPAWSTTSGLS